MLTCYSCSKQKNDLHAKKSGLLSGVNLLMCQTCIDHKFEPRWVIILAGRQHGPSHVRDFIVRNKYVGREISAHELIV